MNSRLATRIRSKLMSYNLFKPEQIHRAIAELQSTRIPASTRVKVFSGRCTCQEYLVDGIWRPRCGRFHAVIELHTPGAVEPDVWTVCDDGCIHRPTGWTILATAYQSELQQPKQ